MKPHAYLLLVDDDPVLLRSTARALGAAGYLVEVAFSAAECRRLASSRRPDLILLDVVLPDESGVEVCRWLKGGAETATTCVVLISGFQTSSGCQESGLAAGADAYIVRPIGTADLVARIGALLRVQQARAALRQTRERLGAPGTDPPSGALDARGSVATEVSPTGSPDFVSPWSGEPRTAEDLAVRLSRLFEGLLTVISSHTSSVREDPRLTPELRAGLDAVLHATRRGADLTLGLLHYGGHRLSRPRVMEANENVERLRPRLRDLLGESIVLEVDLAPGLPPIFADPDMIERLLLSLAANARDAMPRGGRFMVRTRSVEIGADAAARRPDAAPGRFLCLSAIDTGCGIAPAVRPRIFEAFFTTKEAGHGFGLGLASVQDVVRQHHGWIEVASELGRGSTFDVYLPIPR